MAHPTPSSAAERYELGPELGAGGMARVYAAWDSVRRREVALKLVPQAVSGSVPNALVREAWVLGRIDHPRVVRSFGLTSVGGVPALAMARVEGVSLGHWLRSGPTPNRILGVLGQVGEALAATHRAGLLHGDIKPSNVMVGAGDAATLIDFGIARPLEPSLSREARPAAGLFATLNDESSLSGTPAYMAPEVFAGEAVDARADQFSFGVLAYQALLGERPFSGRSLADLAHAVLYDRPKPIPREAPLSPRVRFVLRRGLARDPEDRFEDMEALIASLGPPERDRFSALVRFATRRLAQRD